MSSSRLAQQNDKKIEQKKEEQSLKKEDEGRKEETKTEGVIENESFFNIAKPNPAEIREKGRILLEMKDIFGEDKTKELFKFIEANFSLGQEKIIEKWIEAEFDNKAK